MDVTFLKQFRAEVDAFMAGSFQSPVGEEQQEEFPGLHYYEPNEELALEVEIERLPESEPLLAMQTSTGAAVEFRRWGRFTFTVEGQEATLTIYTDPDGTDYFLPFRDATNGEETYEAGRYLDTHRPGLRPLDNGRFQIDLNFAYNPFCAYNPNYSCPLPPVENWLKVPIRAGEKRFK